MYSVIDAHIHLDQYEETERLQLLADLDENRVESLIAVSTTLKSSHVVLDLAKRDSRIKPAIGWHPEQPLPSEEEVQSLLELIDKKKDQVVAIGEVGLPWYARQNNPTIQSVAYERILEKFIKKAADCELPIVLHAIYDDAATACHLLEKYGVKRAHFHWFKGSDAVLGRMLANGYVVSVPPEVVYRPKIQRIAMQTPLTQLMVETDGPWPFEGPFVREMTSPSMLHASVKEIARLKGISVEETYSQLLKTTKGFFSLD